MKRYAALCLISLLVVLGLPMKTLANGDLRLDSRSYLTPTEFRLAEPDFLDSYGITVAADGDDAFIGAPLDNEGLVFTPGLVDVYRRDTAGWSLHQTLAPNDGSSGDEFGRAIAADGDVVVIGAPAKNQRRGAAYVYRKSAGTWALEATLLAADPQADASFGSAAAIDGDTVVIGAPGYNQRRGAVYVFGRTGGAWSQRSRLAPTPNATNDDFGVAVQLEGGKLLVGAPGSDTQGPPANNVGAAFFFEPAGDTWHQTQRLVRPVETANQAFGVSLALSGDRAVVGAPYANVSGVSSAGAALTYRRNGSVWSLDTELRALTPGASEYFGYSVALVRERLVVGIPRGNVAGGSAQGAAEVFIDEFGLWLPSERLAASAPSQNARFGDAVALANDFVVIGAPQTSGFEGAAYAFENRSTSLQFTQLPGTPVRIGEAYVVAVALAASSGTPGGVVLVRDDQGHSCSATLSAGAGSCSLSATAVGPRVLRARYNGAPGFAESFGTASVQVKPDLRLQPASLADGQIGVAYSQLFDTAATGATLPLVFSRTAGTLPAGMTLGGNGLLAGTPTEFGSFSFTVAVSDSSSAALGGPFSESRSYTLVIQPPFRTALALGPVASPRDRGVSVVFDALLDVIEEEGGAPSGTYSVTAVNGASTLACSAPVSAEGVQSCSIEFGPGAAVGDYAITARFTSANADFGNSSDSDSLRLLSPADPSVGVLALDPLYLPDDSLRFRIDVQNSGPDVAYALRLQAPAPAGLLNPAWTCTGAACPAASGSGAIDLQIAALPPGASLQIQLSGSVGAAPPASITASASLSLDPAGFSRELDPANNSANAGSLPLRLFANGFETPED